MRSIGFLGLVVDEKHGSLHAALVLHGKEQNQAVGWEERDAGIVEPSKTDRYFLLLQWAPEVTTLLNRVTKMGVVPSFLQIRCAP